MGGLFEGVYDLRRNRLLLPDATATAPFRETVECRGLDDPALDARLPAQALAPFRESAELALGAYAPLDIDAYRAGHLTPVYFGSALKDFAVRELLDGLAAWAPPPRVQPAKPRDVAPDEDRVTGFVFKVQANMDPNHRDRVAFLRLCSGRFKRGMKLKQVHRGKTISVNNPVFFFAQERALADEAQAGDIIGIPNHGVLRVGDTLTEGEDLRFTGIPNFAPEILRRVQLEDPIRSKQMRRALEDLAEEGVAQVFRPLRGADWIVGVVGALQLDVLTTRIAGEYKVAVRFEQSPYEAARWIAADDKAELDRFIERYRSNVALDRDEAPVFLAGSTWELNHATEKWPKIRFSATRERT
jgi:peptide chain release factor 3